MIKKDGKCGLKKKQMIINFVNNNNMLTRLNVIVNRFKILS